MNDENPANPPEAGMQGKRPHPWLLGILFLGIVGITFGVAMLLVTIFEHKQEARQPYVRLVEVDEVTTDPEPWGVNWPFQFDSYRRTVDSDSSDMDTSNVLTASKLQAHPWLKRLYAGYAFSIDYRELRGHAYMLYDQEVTERVTKRTQSGACLHCHASVVPTYRRLGLIERGQSPDAWMLAGDFDWPAVMAGFRQVSTMTYAEAHAELLKTPDGTPGENKPLFPGGSSTERATPANLPTLEPEPAPGPDPHSMGEAHPVSCVDCHDPNNMKLRITRPGFMNGIAALARSSDPVPHLPSVERWRKGNREIDYDPNAMATRQEMRSFACAQCHVEYYCASKETLFFPWERGLKVEQFEATYDTHTFPDGSPFLDYIHGETGAPTYKAQHPEFELWSQGVHARSGVSCTDCHMPYERQGAAKVTSHWVRSPMQNINNACQTCHNVPEEELREKVATIQGRTVAMIDRSAEAMTDMLDAILEAQAAGASEAELAPILKLQNKATWRLDFISSENSKGFHADQEAVRILGESIDYSRRAQAAALRLRTSAAPGADRTVEPVQGISNLSAAK